MQTDLQNRRQWKLGIEIRAQNNTTNFGRYKSEERIEEFNIVQTP